MANRDQPLPAPENVPDQWEFYLAKVDHRPASILFNDWYKNHLPIAELPVLYWCRIQMRDAAEHGMGVGEDAEALTQLEDTLNDEASAHGLYPVGRLRNDGVWQIAYYGPKGKDIKLIASLWLDPVEREYEVGSSDDPEWSYYIDFLLPDEERSQWIADCRVIENLRKHGDPLSSPRRVDHWVFCNDEASRSRFRDDAVNMGFSVENEWIDKENSPSQPFIIQIYRTDVVELEEIHAVIMQLVNLAKSVDVTYDGWETFVIKPDQK